jgi:hypothetical protein
MKEFLEKILAGIPKYVSDFINVLSAPIKFVRKYNRGDEPSLSEPFIFLAISLVVTLVTRIPMLRKDVDVTTFIAVDGLWKLLIVLIVAGSMKLAWRVVKGKANFLNLLVTNCYYFGVFSVLTHLLLLSGSYFNSGDRVIYAIYSGKALGLFSILQIGIYLIGFGFLTIWCLICWKAYHELNGVSKLQSLTAFVLTIVFSIFPLMFVATIREMLTDPFYS